VSHAAELRVGILGTGFVGRIHARSARLAGATIVGAAASSPDRADAAARELGAERGFATAEELIACERIDVVHICTPNHLHVPLARAALQTGKHVVCEKPVALDGGDGVELLAARDRADRVVTVPFAYRYYPTVREARARIRSGATGDLRLVHGGYLQDWLLEPTDDNWRVDAALGGASRAFADIGSHWCDLIEFVSGQRISSVIAHTLVANPERRRSAGRSFERAAPRERGTGRRTDPGEDAVFRPVATEDIAAVLFETDHGAAGSVVISQVSAGRKNRLWFEISGTTETVAFDQEQPESLWVGRRPDTVVLPRDFGILSPEAAAYVTLPGGHPQGFHDCFDAFVAETFRAIVDGDPPEGLPMLEDGVRAVRITEAVLESARSRGWVEVPDRLAASGA
jgi:predicted dehydrogenase